MSQPTTTPKARRTWPGPASGIARRQAWLPALLLGLGLSLAAPTASSDSREKIHTIIAAMIVKLPSFTKWPASSPGAAGDQATLAVVTNNPDVLATFRQGVEGRTIGGLTWRVEPARTASEAGDHRFVFFASDAPKPDTGWYAARRSRGVLTFGEGVDHSCMFNFVIIDGRVRFDLDMVHARAAGMGVDPRLFKLARQVRHKP